jgi:hypothetical protein
VGRIGRALGLVGGEGGRRAAGGRLLTLAGLDVGLSRAASSIAVGRFYILGFVDARGERWLVGQCFNSI